MALFIGVLNMGAIMEMKLFMHQLRISEKGVELFGIPLVIELDIAEITVILN